MTARRIAVLAAALLAITATPLFAAGISDLGWTELLPLHIVAMSLAAAGFLTGGIIARFFKKRIKQWLKVHRALQWSSTVVALIGIATGVLMTENTFGSHFNGAHSIIAVISFGLAVTAITSAYLFLKGKKHKKEFRFVHRWAGRLGSLGFLATIVFGLYAAGIV